MGYLGGITHLGHYDRPHEAMCWSQSFADHNCCWQPVPERSSAVERTLVGEHRLADIVAAVADRPVAEEHMTAVEEHTLAVEVHTLAVEEHTTAVGAEPLAEPRLVPTFVRVVETRTGSSGQPTEVRQHN